ncbi:MAG: bifunctional 4-hydroxy-2-oxoglutarate aldolase/2-dehydro-3-deoxy-phosphogluconate aldolase [Clostridia bacterium]|nr:bifunctional 4-hydroxy-2-oxoglutarate aldolase/2-dehydro-3-deoxy-phosphogluconate aldolase [Clostridia bacterium]
MHPVIEQLKLVGLVPVIKLNDPEKAVPLAKALVKGGIPVAEVTFRAAGADKAIAAIAKEVPEVLVGAGTVITIDQVKQAVSAGAKYIISPGFDKEVVQYCVDNNIPITPGCTNPSEVSIATKMGLEAVKFFPAEAMGGLKVIKSLAGPFPKMRFIPTGGIGPDNLKDYLAFDKIIACGGSWMVPEKLIDNEDWDAITALAKEAVLNMLNITLCHIGINSADNDTCEATANSIAQLTGALTKPGNSSVFVGSQFEIMRKVGRGTNGHIALGASNVERAVRYFESQGFEFDKDSLVSDEKGAKAIYFKGEFGGFGIHLLRK